MKYNLIINDREFDVEVGAVQDGYAQVFVNDELFEVDIANFQNIGQAPPAPQPRRSQPAMARRVQAAPRQAQPVAARPQPAPRAAVQAPPQAKAAPKAAPAPATKQATAAPKTASNAGSAGAIKAPMPGLIIDIKVKVGDTVKVGQVVAIMEAMKMENDLPSTLDGTIKEVRVQKGTQVSTGDVLIVIG